MLLYNILLMSLFLGTFYRFLTKTKSNVLGCGLFGGGFRVPIDDEIRNKLAILGIFNQKRGEHSCGYFNGEKIFKGVDANKKFSDFLISNGIVLPQESKNNIFIGHTRHATYGSHTEKNAHPFNINDRMIIAKNGTIKNIWPLCTKYHVPVVNIDVDSEALGYLLDKEGYKVLEEYKGEAAIVLHKKEEPNVLYLYHGAARLIKDGTMWEERPLFYMVADEGVYISSLEEALTFIRTEGDMKPEKLPHNTIFRIKSGKLQKTKITINRGDANLEPVSTNTTFYRNQYHEHIIHQNKIQETIKGLNKKYPSVTVSVKDKDVTVISGNYHMDMSGINILNESYPIETTWDSSKFADGRVYFHKGRFWKVYRKGFELLHGFVSLNRKTGEVVSFENKTSDRCDNMYFFRGIPIEDGEKYNKLLNAELGNGSNKNLIEALKQGSCFNFAEAVSYFTNYQVSLLASESTGLKVNREWWYQSGKLAQSCLTPKFSSRDYHFKDGKLIRIKSKDTTDKIIMNNSVNDDLPFPDPVKLKRNLPESNNYYENISSDDVAEYSKKFKTVYSSIDEIKEDFGDIGMLAMAHYVTELSSDVFKNKGDLSEEATNALIDDCFDEAIKSQRSVYDVMQSFYDKIDVYIMDAMVILNQDKETDDESLHDQSEDQSLERIVSGEGNTLPFPDQALLN